MFFPTTKIIKKLYFQKITNMNLQRQKILASKKSIKRINYVLEELINYKFKINIFLIYLRSVSSHKEKIIIAHSKISKNFLFIINFKFTINKATISL